MYCLHHSSLTDARQMILYSAYSVVFVLSANNWRPWHDAGFISHTTCAIIVAWLERFEDRLEFPIADLATLLHPPMSFSSGYYSILTKRGSHSTSLPVVFIHPLSSRSDLYCINTYIEASR